MKPKPRDEPNRKLWDINQSSLPLLNSVILKASNYENFRFKVPILLVYIIYFFIATIILMIVGHVVLMLLDGLAFYLTFLNPSIPPFFGWFLIGIAFGGLLGIIQGFKYTNQPVKKRNLHRVMLILACVIILNSILIRTFGWGEFKVLFRDTFDSSSTESNDWLMNPPYSLIDKGANAIYQETSQENSSVNFWSRQSFKSVEFSADIKKISGPRQLSKFGLIAQSNPKGYYFIYINDNGEFALGKTIITGNEQLNLVVRAGFSSLIRQGNQQWNSLTIRFDGSRVTGWVNGERVSSFRDSTHSHGQIGLFSYLVAPEETVSEDSNFVAVYFDNVQVKTRLKDFSDSFSSFVEH